MHQVEQTQCLSTRGIKNTLDWTNRNRNYTNDAHGSNLYKTPMLILTLLQESLNLAYIAALHKLNFLETWTWTEVHHMFSVPNWVTLLCAKLWTLPTRGKSQTWWVSLRSKDTKIHCAFIARVSLDKPARCIIEVKVIGEKMAVTTNTITAWDKCVCVKIRAKCKRASGRRQRKTSCWFQGSQPSTPCTSGP